MERGGGGAAGFEPTNPSDPTRLGMKTLQNDPRIKTLQTQNRDGNLTKRSCAHNQRPRTLLTLIPLIYPRAPHTENVS